MAQYDFSDFDDEKPPIDPLASSMSGVVDASPMSKKVMEYTSKLGHEFTPEGLDERKAERAKEAQQYLEDMKTISHAPIGSPEWSGASERSANDNINLAMGSLGPSGVRGLGKDIKIVSRDTFNGKVPPQHLPEADIGRSVGENHRLNNAKSVYYAVKDNKVVGHLGLDDAGSVKSIYVDPAHRNEGIATKLYEGTAKDYGSFASDDPMAMEQSSKNIWEKLKEKYPDRVYKTKKGYVFEDAAPVGLAGAGILGASALASNESQAGDKMPQYDFSDFDDKPAAPQKPASQYDFSDFEEKPKMSETESAIRGGIQGLPAIGPWADEAQGAAEALWEKAKGDPKEFGELYKQHRDAARSKYKEAAETNPKSYMGGMAVPIGAMAIPKAIPVLGTAASGALGAIEGAGASESEDPAQIAKDAALMGGLSAGTAGLYKLAGPAISKGISSMGEKAGSAAENLAARAMGAERGTIKKLGAENVKDIGRYGLDQKIVTPLASAKEMQERNAVIQALSGKKMGDVYSKIDEAGASKFMPMDVAEQVSNELSPRFRTPINKSEWGQLDATIESIQSRGGQAIPLGEAQKLKEEIGSVAYPMGKRAMEPNPKQQMAMDAYTIINEAIDKATEEGAKTIGSKELSSELAKAKKMYGQSKGAEKLLENRVAKEQGNKPFGLTDWVAASGHIAGAAASGGESVPYSLAMMGGKKAAEKYGAGASAVALNKVSQLLQSAPDKLGKYGPILQKAALRGEASLNTAHQMLLKDPEYQKLVGGLE